MSDIKIEFETLLTNKLCLKSTDSISEEEILLKLFQQFDLNNNEICNEDDFIQVIKQIGISGFKDEELISLFQLYKNNDNKFNYIEFINNLYDSFIPEQTFNPEKNKIENNNIDDINNIIINNNTNNNNIINNNNNNIINNNINSNSNKNQIKKISIMKINKHNREISKNEKSIEEIINQIKNKLSSRGIRGISSIAENFRKIDKDNSQGIDFEEFKSASKEFKFELNDNELKKAFNFFDKNNNGIIEYDEFIRTIRGEMNDFRKKIVFNAFKLIDINNTGAVNIEDIKRKYNAKNHPDVINGKKNEEQIYNEFINNFEIAYNYLNGNESDGIVIFDDFLEYYQNISMSIDNDDYFELLVNSEWGVNNNNNNNKNNINNGNDFNYNNYEKISLNKFNNNNDSLLNTAEQTPIKKYNINNYNNNIFPNKNIPINNQNIQMNYNPNYNNIISNINFSKIHNRNFSYLNPNQLNPFKKFRDIISSRGPRGIMSLKRSFMLADDNNSKIIDFDEFLKYCYDYKIPLNDDEKISIFSQFDINGDGQINYIDFLNILIGKMNSFRFQIVTQVFNSFDINDNGFININDMKKYYNVKNHPDVINGRRSAPEVEAEFLDNIDYHFQLLRTNKLRNGEITFQDFTEYYDIISMSIHSDVLFQNILVNVWDLDINNKVNIDKSYTKRNNNY